MIMIRMDLLYHMLANQFVCWFQNVDLLKWYHFGQLNGWMTDIHVFVHGTSTNDIYHEIGTIDSRSNWISRKLPKYEELRYFTNVCAVHCELWRRIEMKKTAEWPLGKKRIATMLDFSLICRDWVILKGVSNETIRYNRW